MNLLQFTNQLAATKTSAQAEAVLDSYLASFGFRSYAFTYYSGHVKSGRKLRYHYVSKALRVWHNHYLAQKYADVDRTLEESHSMTLPLFWDAHQQLKLAKNKREQRIREESIEHGIDQGLSIPVYGPQQDFATLALHQRVKETCLQKYESKQFEWMSAVQIYYHHIRRILNLSEKHIAPFQLTKREIQCLSYTQKSWRVEQIAKALKISVRTVNFHLQNANKKLGQNNKYQSAYRYFGRE